MQRDNLIKIHSLVDSANPSPRQNKPLVYSCSGCSNVAQLANDIAITLDREGFAEMSCIAGVGGNVKPLVKKAASGRPIIAIDGCKLNCVKACLGQHQINPTEHIELTDYDIKKQYGGLINFKEGGKILKQVYKKLGITSPASLKNISDNKSLS